jgi:hypothetical protein
MEAQGLDELDMKTPAVSVEDEAEEGPVTAPYGLIVAVLVALAVETPTELLA